MQEPSPPTRGDYHKSIRRREFTFSSKISIRKDEAVRSEFYPNFHLKLTKKDDESDPIKMKTSDKIGWRRRVNIAL